MNICFLARPSYDRFSTLIYKNMKLRYDSSLKGVFITSNSSESNYVEKQVADGICCEMSKFINQNWDDLSAENLSLMEKKYDCAPVWKYIYADRFLINRPLDYVIKIADGLFRFFEWVFTAYDIEIYYSETIATLQCYIAYIVGKKIGVRYLAQMTARGLDNTHHYVLVDPYQGVLGFDANYKNNSYTEKEILNAEKFLSTFEKTNNGPQNMQFVTQKPKIGFKDLTRPIVRFIRRFDPVFRDEGSYMYYSANKNITDPLLFYIRYQTYKKLYKMPDFSRKYVYFPLHYQPEAATIVCAQKYEKQLFLIDSLAKSLPGDTVLYVKEHYAKIGHRERSFYKELNKYPNVVLIDPFANSRDLMKHSVAVITLTGTAGWEAMLLRKPVLIGGNIFFDNAPGVMKFEDIFENYLELIDQWIQPKRKEILIYLCEYFRHIYPGQIYNDDPKTYEESNINLVVDSLWKSINDV